MAITFSIQNTEIIMTTPQINVEVQDLVNAIRLFEDDFRMMSFDHIIDAEGKATLPGVGVFTEIVMTLRNPWTIRFEDEATAHVNVTGGTTLAVDAINDPRPVTTNFGITIAQAASGILIESDKSGLTPIESAALLELWRLQGLDAANPMTVTPTSRSVGGITQVISGDGDTTSTVTRS